MQEGSIAKVMYLSVPPSVEGKSPGRQFQGSVADGSGALELESDKINAANANYIIEVDSVSKLPTDKYSKTNPPSDAQAKQKFEVGDGTVNISGMKWTYTYLHEGTEVPAKEYIKNAPDADDNTKLVYTPITATTVLP